MQRFKNILLLYECDRATLTERPRWPRTIGHG